VTGPWVRRYLAGVAVDATLPVGAGAQVLPGLRVEVIEGPNRGKVVLARQERLAVGSAESNDLVLADPTVSRFHLELETGPHGIRIADLGSTNGTLLSGARLERAIIPSGATLKIGRSALRVEAAGELAVAAYDGEHFGSIVGRSPAMLRLLSQVERAAASDASVVLLGETGTGKEVIARAIHEASPRRGAPFETVDCAAILPNLIASELFGHERGAFTGADERHLGAFERAHGGSVFLDEIGELPASLQTMLLGVLERRAFRRVGGKAPIPADVRLIAATHRDLRSEVNTGAFRQDLFYRLAVVVLRVPALRDRLEDVPALATHFLRLLGHEQPLESLLPEELREHLAAYSWPGNVRELRNLVEAAVVMGEAPPMSGTQSGVEESGTIRLGPLLEQPYSDAKTLVVDRFEDAYVTRLLERSRGNVAEAARIAKMNRSYLTRLLKRRGFERD
jgi:DNA-binding NtrC family response regulator